jgi:hypothetical protein
MTQQIEVRDPSNAYFGRIADVVEVINHPIAGNMLKVRIGNISFIIHEGNTKPVA